MLVGASGLRAIGSLAQGFKASICDFIGNGRFYLEAAGVIKVALLLFED